MALSPASSRGIDTSTANTWTGNQTAPAWIASGLTGATAASRYVGATASGAPASGTFAIGDLVVDQTGKLYVCTVAGSPGTWTQVGGSGGATKLFDSTVTGSDAATIDTGAAGIAAGYAAIEVFLYARNDDIAVGSGFFLRFNNDSGNNYDLHRVNTSGTGTATGVASAATSGIFLEAPAASAAASYFQTCRLMVAAYDGTAGYKSGIGQAGFLDSTGANFKTGVVSGTWRNTAAITRVAATGITTSKFKVGSRLVIMAYG